MKFDIRETAKERVILCAHRGVWGGNIPCNNIIAYDAAIAFGADMVEIDVTKAKDGELFIFHPGMEKRHLNRDIHLEEMTTDEIRALRLCNYDGDATDIPINTLDEVLEHLKGRCFINIDKFGFYPAEIIEKVKAHNMNDQIILKCAPEEEQLRIVETYAPDIQFLPIIKADNGIHEQLKARNINYIGSELVFDDMNAEIASVEYRERLHRDGKLCWINSIIYNYKVQLSAGHSDDAAVGGNPELGWGWCADNYDIIQTDWIYQVATYLEKTGRRYKKK